MSTQESMPKIADVLNFMCSIASTIKNTDKNVQIIEGLGEINLNGVDYQVQVVLEPEKSNWAQEDKPTIRKTI